jgi:IS6 family transposase
MTEAPDENLKCANWKLHLISGPYGLPQRVRLRHCKYLNNVIGQDHRTVKKRNWLANAYNTFQSAWRTIEGLETMNMIRKGRIRWVAKKDVIAEARFIAKLFGLAA